MRNLIVFHPGDLGLSDLLRLLLNLAGYSFVILPFILGGIAIFVLRRNKKREDVK